MDITNKQMEISTQLNSMIYFGLSWIRKLMVYRHGLEVMSIMLWIFKEPVEVSIQLN